MWTQRLKKAGWRAVRPCALQLLRHTGTFDVTWRSLRQLRKRGLQVKFAVDAGAATGEWARGFRRIYRDARILCIEPRQEAQAELSALAGKLGNVEVAQVLVGDAEKEVCFYEHDDQSSVLKNSQGKAFGVEKKHRMTTLDALLAERGLPAPDFIKLDLQGAELLCLRGAARSLPQAQAVLLEVSFIPLYKNSPVLADIVSFMQQHSFRCYDVLSLWHRPLDGALAFGDFVFLREQHPLLQDSRWSEGPV